MDSIQIKGLVVSTRIGVYAWEQKINQRLLIDIFIPTNLSACEDNIENTLDYNRLCQGVAGYVESKAFLLIETVANEVAQFIKTEFNVAAVTVTVNKPGAIKNTANVSVSVIR